MARRIFFALITLIAFFFSVHVSSPNRGIVRQPEADVSFTPVRWEHGWKTKRVIATRYISTVKGGPYDIGFRYPRNPYHAKNAAVFEFYRQHGGECFYAGIGPDVEQFVNFRDVHDAKSADKKLEEILPQLSELLESMDRL